MRPTGKLHLGNYMGALANWVKLQDDYECYFFIADWHALTTDYADPSRTKLNTLDVALDWLAAGLDPEKSTIFIQSHVPQHAELHLLFSMITPLGWLERVPTYKEQQENIKGKDLTTYGFLGYPLLQSADILLYQPQFVPVGQDQVAHVELTREVARRFNSMYRQQDRADVFPEPEALLTPSPKLLGTDGRKMSKSYGNTIGLTEAPIIVESKIKSMSTNGQRVRQTDSGNPDLCPVGDLHNAFSLPEVSSEWHAHCRNASEYCVNCKQVAANSVTQVIGPMHEKRLTLESNIPLLWEKLREQSRIAEARAELTMRDARGVLDLDRGPSLKELESLQARLRGYEQDQQGYDFSPFSDRWNNSHFEMEVAVRKCWQHLLPTDIAFLVPNTPGYSPERLYEEAFILLSKKKRVFATASRDTDQIFQWNFDIPTRSYDVWVLLCGSANGTRLQDFVLPPKVYVQAFSSAKKSNPAGPIKVSVSGGDGRFMLKIDQSEPINITDRLRNYEPLR